MNWDIIPGTQLHVFFFFFSAQIIDRNAAGRQAILQPSTEIELEEGGSSNKEGILRAGPQAPFPLLVIILLPQLYKFQASCFPSLVRR